LTRDVIRQRHWRHSEATSTPVKPAHLCATGANYVVTVCPNGGSASFNGTHTLALGNALF
jgi:hypothetical protein